ncbi:uncharacterized protein BX664DRAFT_341477 [Halteromyces radiatus]|uniref:uncharacterized protein n=1 Tax=Halteromyces radiatus TaxID=101107 RepID=UPI00221FB4A5|nr:uncharacterized protein BX664DRAFT_341477 [Halteromyces radiatus]KAI8079798.1 hypothetical protein BX664DRAFT_341477 [Halteromyces radiatus]
MERECHDGAIPTTPLPKNKTNSRKRTIRYCHACQQPCLPSDRTLIRALGQIYHSHCFTCEDCQLLVTDKFYALKQNTTYKIVCEQHYYAQMCVQCPDHDPIEPKFEFQGRLYCLLHFSAIKEIQCAGCHQAIVKQFVENKTHPGKKWHPECYMIFKFWNVRLADTLHENDNGKLAMVRLEENQLAMERKVNRIWTDLSSFEESSATCISDMLLLMAAGAYVEGFRMASQFIMHLEVLYNALDNIRHVMTNYNKVLPCEKECKIVSNQVIRFFHLLAHPDGSLKDNKLGVTQELLCLVTSLAQNLKTLIRIGLTEALSLERDCHVADAIPRFLNNLLELERKRVWIGGRYWFKEDPFPLDRFKLDHPQEQCYSCKQPIDNDCYQHENHQEQWHPSCFICSKCQHPLTNDLLIARCINESGTRVLVCDPCITHNDDNDNNTFIHLTQLQYYIYLLKLALSRLYFVMHSSSGLDKQSNEQNHAKINTNKDDSSPFLSTNFLRLTKDMNPSTGRRPSLFGSVHFGNIRRAKSNRLDQISEHPQDQLSNHSSHLTKRSFTIHSHTLEEDNIKASSSTIGRVFSTSRSARMGSIRKVLSRHGERASIYNLFDRRPSKQQSTLDTQNDKPFMASSVSPSLFALTPKHYLMIRQLAAKTIGAYLPHLYSMEQWMMLVECKKPSLWDKFKTRIKSEEEENFSMDRHLLHHYNKTGNLDHMICLFSSQHCKVPPFMQHCILTLLQRDMSVEGIFRKNGNIRELKQLEDTLAKKNTISMMELLDQQSSIQLAALLKRYLRALPEPLLTFRLYPVFMAAINLKREQDIKRTLHLACCMLPKENRDIMQAVFGFLFYVATFKDQNKMDIYNLARIMAPSVLYDHQEGSQTIPHDEIKVVEWLIRYHDSFSKTPEDMLVFLSDIDDPKWKQTLKKKTSLHSPTYDMSPFPGRRASQPAIIQTSTFSKSYHRLSWRRKPLF